MRSNYSSRGEGRERVVSRSLRSARHDLSDSDYESRIVGALLRNYGDARPVTKHLAPHHLAHPQLAAILHAIRFVEAKGETLTISAVRERLVTCGFRGAVPFIAEAIDNYVASADGPRLHLFVERIRRLAELRWLLGLADGVDLTLADRRLDRSSRIERAHEGVRTALAEFGVDPRRTAA